MRSELLRLLFLVAPATGLVLACSGDESPAAVTGEEADAGADTSVEGDAKPPSTEDAEAGAGAKLSSFVVANDVASVTSAIRVCVLASASSDEPTVADAVAMKPAPESAAGLGAGRLATIDLPIKLAGHSIKPVMFYTSSLEAFELSGKSCSELLAVSKSKGDPDNASAVLFEGLDFEYGSKLPRTHFKDSSKYVALFTGCPLATAPDRAVDCIQGIDTDDPVVPTTSEFVTHFYELDPSGAAAPKNRAQFIMGSGSLGLKDPMFELNVFDGTVLFGANEIAIEAPAGGMPFRNESGSALPKPGTEVPSLTDFTGFRYTPSAGGSPQTAKAADILSLSGLTQADLKSGKAYTFMVIGSGFLPELLDNGSPNPEALHIVLIPND